MSGSSQHTQRSTSGQFVAVTHVAGGTCCSCIAASRAGGCWVSRSFRASPSSLRSKRTSADEARGARGWLAARVVAGGRAGRFGARRRTELREDEGVARADERGAHVVGRHRHHEDHLHSRAGLERAVPSGVARAGGGGLARTSCVVEGAADALR